MTGATESVRVPIASEVDIVTARQRGREIAVEAGFSGADPTLIATAVSELARNVLQHAGQGEVVFTLAVDRGRRGVVVEARDEGPGIADVPLALQDGYSTAGSLGLGLPGVRRLMDDFEVTSGPSGGTTVRTCKWLA